MDRKKWLSEIDKLDIWPDLKLKIINLMTITNNNLRFYKIINDNVKNSFINIKSYKNVYIAFDIEFQAVIINNNTDNFKTDVSPRKDDVASFPRELGMLLFIRDKLNDIYYLGSLHINFRWLTEYGFDKDNFKYMLSMYTTVSDATLKEMEKNDEIFRLDHELDKLKKDNYSALLNSEVFKLENDKTQSKVIDIIDELKNTKISNYHDKQKKIDAIIRMLQRVAFAVYGKYLNTTKSAFDKQFKLYYSDPLVISRMMTKNQELKFIKAFIDISDDACFIVKGFRDLEAINNLALLLKLDRLLNIEHIYDIEIFNGFSKMKYGSAQLESTYNGVISSDIYKINNQDLNEIINEIGGIAHNPLTDSYYTLVVAIVMNLGLNDYFKTYDVIDGSIYLKLYELEKQKYLKLNKNK